MASSRFEDLVEAFPNLDVIAPRVREQMAIEAIYAGYVERQKADIEALRRDEALLIPGGLDYSAVGGLSNEVRTKLELHRPETLGQASRIEGVTPGALTALLAHVRRKQKAKAG